MGVRKMQGVSAHLEYVRPKERKPRKNCVHYDDKICKCTKAPSYLLKCVGRFCCKYYDNTKKVRKRY